MGISLTAILFFALAFTTEVIGTVSGFGSSVFFVPLAGMLFDFKSTLALTGILHIFSTSAQVFMFRKEIDWPLALKIGVPSVIFVIVGASLSDKVDLKYAEFAMGIFLIAFALTFLTRSELKFNPTNFNAVVGGAVAGFLAGLIGTGGAVRGATLAAFDLQKGTFVGTSASIDLAVDFSRTVVYLSNGYLDRQYYWYVPVLLVMAWTGAFVGKMLLKKIPQKIFKKIVLFLILAVGVFMIYGVVTGSQVIK